MRENSRRRQRCRARRYKELDPYKNRMNHLTKLGPSMETFNIREAKTHLSRLIERVIAGEEIVIAKAGMPVARLVPVLPADVVREPGSLEGQIRIGPDFNAPPSEEVIALFEGRPVRR